MHTPTDINALFQAVESRCALSAASMQALTIADIGAMIQAGRGTLMEDVMAREAVWHLTPGNGVSQICRAFQVFAQSAVRTSRVPHTSVRQCSEGLERRSVVARR